ncbi:MAG TPA: permease [Cyanothece sp. UBA12306]|nr:permease [Cyanothece sp. UBA12306]
MSQLNYVLTLFISHVIQSLPFLLLGIIVSSGLLAFVDEHQIVTKLPRNRILGAIFGSSLGMILPVGQYGNIPVTRRLLLQGVSLPVCVSFLIAAPTINPFVIAMSWTILANHPRLMFLRILGAWLIGVIMGLIFSAYPNKPPSETENIAPLAIYSTLLQSGTLLLASETSQPLHRAGSLIYEYQDALTLPKSLPRRLYLFADNLIREFLELGSILIVGCGIAATIQAFLPEEQLLQWGQTPVTQILVMSVFASVLSVGSLWNPYFINPLNSTFIYGSNLAFLLLSSLIDLKTIALLFITLRPKIAIYLLILATQLILLLCFAINFYFS